MVERGSRAIKRQVEPRVGYKRGKSWPDSKVIVLALINKIGVSHLLLFPGLLVEKKRQIEGGKRV